MLICFDVYIYIFIELEVDVFIFSQLVSMSLSSRRNFSSRFQLCFDFAMHYGSLYCPFNIIEKGMSEPLFIFALSTENSKIV